MLHSFLFKSKVNKEPTTIKIMLFILSNAGNENKYNDKFFKEITFVGFPDTI